jgi:hypothetical protein
MTMYVQFVYEEDCCGRIQSSLSYNENDNFFDRLKGMFRVVGEIEALIPDKWESS